MMDPEDEQSFDVMAPEAIGKNLRLLRTLGGYSLRELAERARVSKTTILHAEQGAPIQKRNLHKILKALWANEAAGLSQKRDMLDESEPGSFVTHSPQENYWHALLDLRKMIPPDNLQRIQEEAERLRLGRLGFVPVFGALTNFIMPQGPGCVLLELHQRWISMLNAGLYQYAMLYVLSGEMLFTYGKDRLEPFMEDPSASTDGCIRLGEGASVGFSTHEPFLLEPASPIPESGPTPRLLWIGSERGGVKNIPWINDLKL